MSELNDDLIERFLTDRFRAGSKPATCNGYRGVLLALWRYAWRKRLIEEQPRDIQKLRVDEPIPSAWRTDELECILSTAMAIKGSICGIPANAWWVGFLLAMYDTGLRRTALLNRRTSDINLQTGWLQVPAAEQKQHKYQHFKLHDDTIQIIRSTNPDQREWLFPWPFTSSHVLTDHYRMILQVAGLPHTERDLFHKLRRTSATALAVATDMNTAKEHLGHSGLSVTRRYLDRTQMKAKPAADMIQRPEVDSQFRNRTP